MHYCPVSREFLLNCFYIILLYTFSFYSGKYASDLYFYHIHLIDNHSNQLLLWLNRLNLNPIKSNSKYKKQTCDDKNMLSVVLPTNLCDKKFKFSCYFFFIFLLFPLNQTVSETQKWHNCERCSFHHNEGGKIMTHANCFSPVLLPADSAATVSKFHLLIWT